MAKINNRGANDSNPPPPGKLQCHHFPLTPSNTSN